MNRIKVIVRGNVKRYGSDAEVLLDFHEESDDEQDSSFDFRGDEVWIAIDPDKLEEFPLGKVFYLSLIPVEEVE